MEYQFLSSQSFLVVNYFYKNFGSNSIESFYLLHYQTISISGHLKLINNIMRKSVATKTVEL